MALDPEYREVLIQTYPFSGGGSRNWVRARPLAGQGFDTGINVECSTGMRMSHPVGTIFKIRAKITDREGGGMFLYTSHNWKYEILSPDEAKVWLADRSKAE